MAILKSEAKLTEPFVGNKEVIVMLSVQDGQTTASATKLDYDAVHALEQMIIDLTFTADTPQTDCETCKHYKLACELFSEVCKYEPTTQTEAQNSNLTFDTPQTERPSCETCRYYSEEEYSDKCDKCVIEVGKRSNYEPQTDCGWK